MEEQWNIKGLEDHLQQEFNVDMPLRRLLDQDKSLHEANLRQLIIDRVEQSYREKEQKISPEVMHHFEKSVMLQVLDNSWKEHLAAMDHLRQGIHFRGYAQKDPKQEYKREAFEMFTSLLDHIKYEVIGILAKVQVSQEEDVQALDEQRQIPRDVHYEHAEAEPVIDDDGRSDTAAVAGEQVPAEQPYVRDGRKIGRNDVCPCGSGKKYKQCHGKLS
jgi:preprotein translocase subunit SecA